MRIIKQAGADPNGYWDQEYWKKYHQKRWHSRWRKVEDTPPYYSIPFHKAVSNNCIKICNLLIALGADPKIKDGDGCSAMFRVKSIPMIRHIEKYGLSLEDRDSRGHTPINKHSSLEELRMLINAGSDVNTKCYEGVTPMMKSVLTLNTSIREIEMLHNAGADFSAVSNFGYNPFHFMIDEYEEKYMRDFYHVARKLLDYGVDLEQPLHRSKSTPLIHAGLCGSVMEMKCFIRLGANKDAQFLYKNRWYTLVDYLKSEKNCRVAEKREKLELIKKSSYF